MRIENRNQLNEIKDRMASHMEGTTRRILICAGTGCLSGGSAKIYEKMMALAESCPEVEIEFGPEVAHGKDTVGIKKSGCHGFCEMGPLVRIEPAGILYTKVKPEDCQEIFEKTVLGDELVERLLYKQDGVTYPTQDEIPFYKKQTRLVLKNCGHIDAENIEVE